MSFKNKYAAEIRQQKRQLRTGKTDPRCGMCGETDLRCLEEHHVAQRRFDEDTVTVCRNCHRKLSDCQLAHPKSIGGEPDILERIGHFLLGLADMLGIAVEKLREFGKHLIENAQAITCQKGRVTS